MATYTTGETVTATDIVRIGRGKVDYSVSLPVDPSGEGLTEIENLSTGRHKVIATARLTLINSASEGPHPWPESDAPRLVPGDVAQPVKSAPAAPKGPTGMAARFHYDFSDGQTGTSYDAQQTDCKVVRKGEEFDRGRCGYDVDGYSVFACTQREARAAAAWLKANNVASKLDEDYTASRADEDEYAGVENCPACGQPIDYCPGHGEIGDPEGAEILANHDNGEHTGCHPAGCEISAEIERVTDQSGHVSYPHTPGYLHDCPACESGPCVCGEPCSDPGCLSGEFGYSHPAGARFVHMAPCVSDHCEHPDSNVDDGESDEDGEPDIEAIEREYAYSSGSLDTPAESVTVPDMARYVCLVCESATPSVRRASVSASWMATHLRNGHAPSLVWDAKTVRTERTGETTYPAAPVPPAVDVMYFAERSFPAARTDEDAAMAYVDVSRGSEFVDVRDALVRFVNKEAEVMADRWNDGDTVSEQARAAAHKLASTRPEDFAGGSYSAVRADAGGVVWSLIRTERSRRA